MANPLSITFHEVAAVTTVDGGYDGNDDDTVRDVSRVIDQAVRKLLARRRHLPTWLGTGAVSRADVVDVVARAVARVTNNPEGLESEQEGTYSYRLSNRVASGDLWFPDDDLAQLSPTGGGTAIGTARVRPTPGWAGW